MTNSTFSLEKPLTSDASISPIAAEYKGRLNTLLPTIRWSLKIGRAVVLFPGLSLTLLLKSSALVKQAAPEHVRAAMSITFFVCTITAGVVGGYAIQQRLMGDFCKLGTYCYAALKHGD